MRVGSAGFVVSVFVAVLAVGGCGSSSKSSSSNAGPTSSSSSSSSTTSPSEASTTVEGGGSGVQFTVDGTYKGQTVKGPVQSGSLQCAPITTGGKQGLQLTWGGTVANTGQISGDVMFAGGQPSITFGDSKSQGEASVVVKGDYQNRYGASSALGSGTASMTTSNSGSINAQLDGGSAGKIQLQGNWKC
jgi:hypothetical protein